MTERIGKRIDRSAIHGILVFLLYAAILTLAALPQGLQTELNVFGIRVPLDSTNEDMLRNFGDADATAYARGAKEIVQYGRIKEPSYPVLWPPGFFVVQALILAAVGPEGPALGVLLILTVCAWSAALTLLYCLCRLAFKPWISLLLPLTFVLFPFFRQYFLRNGVVFSESLSAALWTAGMVSLLLAVARGRTLGAAIAGALFAVAAYIRATVDLVLIFASAVVALDLALRWFYGARARGAWLPEVKGTWNDRELRALLFAIIAFNALTMPYRIYKTVTYGSPMFSKADYYYKYLWQPVEEFTPIQGFVLEGGGPVACALNPTICKELALDRTARGQDAHSSDLYKRLANAELLAQPVRWVRFKLRHLPKYWFSKPSVGNPVPGSKVPGAVLALALVGAVGLFPLILRRRLGPTLFMGMVMLYGGHFLIFLFVHFEVRYLYWLQTSALLFLITNVVAWRMAQRTAEQPRPG